MKTIAKRLFATVLALALMCTMVTGFAANIASVTQVRILDSADDTTPDVYTTFDESIEVTEGQLIEVTAQLTDAETEQAVAGDLTFLSRLAGEGVVLSNDTIQYVTQVSVTAETNTATITFRPRTTIDTPYGAFVANVGGTDVAEAATFSYDVEKAKANLGMSPASDTSIEYGSDKDIQFNLTNYNAEEDLIVTLNGVALESGVGYEIESNVLTIKYEALKNAGVGNWVVEISNDNVYSTKPSIDVEVTAIELTMNLTTSVDITEGSGIDATFELNRVVAEGDVTVTVTKAGTPVETSATIKDTVLTVKTAGLEVGEYTVAISGTGYKTVDATFEVKEKPLGTLGISGTVDNIEIDEIDDETTVSYTVSGIGETNPNVAVKSSTGEYEVLDAQYYEFTGESAEKTLTIEIRSFVDKADTYTVKVYGDAYKNEETATFTVIADTTKYLELTAKIDSIYENESTDITFDIVNYVDGDPVTVTLVDPDKVDVPLESGDWSIVNGVLTIKNSALGEKKIGKYTVTVSGEGYDPATAEFTVKAKIEDPAPGDGFTEEEAEAAKDAILDIELTISDNKVTIPATVSVGDKNIPVEHNVTCKDVAISESNGVITYDPDATDAPFVSKAEVSIYVKGSDVAARTETIYFIHPDTTAEEITFGNVTAIADGNGQDAFASADSFNAAMSDSTLKAEILATRAKALNVVLGRRPNIVHDNTLNFDKDDKITLNEYRIFKLMLDEDGTKPEAFTYENVMSVWSEKVGE